jgi:hypothetical protein
VLQARKPVEKTMAELQPKNEANSCSRSLIKGDLPPISGDAFDEKPNLLHAPATAS